MSRKKKFSLNGVNTIAFDPNGVQNNGDVQADVSTPIKLTDEEQAAIKELDQKILHQKLLIADLHIQSQQQLKKAVDDFEVLRTGIIEKANSILKAHGVNLNNPDQGNWNLNTDNMMFTRT